jgi:hypothetical protein
MRARYAHSLLDAKMDAVMRLDKQPAEKREPVPLANRSLMGPDRDWPSLREGH